MKSQIVLHGDGSMGLNAMELDTAVRHNIPVLVVISLNGGWTADPCVAVHFGLVMSAGRTQASNCSSVSSSNATPASLRVMPSL